MGSKKSSEPARIDPGVQAQQNLAAKQATDPQSAALEFGIQSQYIPQLSELYSGVREQQLPGGGALNQALIDQSMNQLMSPTGMTAEQQFAQDSIRNREISRAQEAMQNTQNLGGTLYGGRSGAARSDDITRMTQGYEMEDYARQIQQQQASQQLAMAIMGQYMGQSIPQLNYQSAVVDPNQQYSSDTSQRGQDIEMQMQADANKSALMSSLFQAVGSAAGGTDFGKMLGGQSPTSAKLAGGG